MNAIVQQLKEGLINPAEALQKFENPFTKAADFKIEDLKIQVLDCGFPSLNAKKVFKKNQGELIIVGARPSQGKSALIFQIAQYVARNGNVAGITLEMSKISLQKRIMAIMTGRSASHIEDGLVPAPLIDKAKKELDNQGLYFCDEYNNIDSLVSATQALHRQSPLDLVVIDYLQLITGGKGGKRSDEIGEISFKLRALAKSLKCPVMAACQLNRKCDDRGKESGDYKPTLADIRESGNIEQDADVVMMLSRQERYDQTRPGEADVEIVKHRNGPTGLHLFKFLSASTRFVDMGEEESL